MHIGAPAFDGGAPLHLCGVDLLPHSFEAYTVKCEKLASHGYIGLSIRMILILLRTELIKNVIAPSMKRLINHSRDRQIISNER